jgi:hypothetical protein
MTDTKPEALRLAEMFDSLKMTVLGAKNALSMEEAATELRRLHEVNAELLEALKAMMRSYEFLKPPHSPISDSQKKAQAAIAKAEETK